MLHRLHLEVRCAHPGLDRPERMLDCLAAQRDLAGIIVEPLLDAFEDRLMLPAANAAFLACGAPVLDRASLARRSSSMSALSCRHAHS